MADKRFARVASDPRFKKIPRKHRKVKIDSRFKRMFTDKTFTTKYFVDKRGAASGKTTKEDLHKFYDLSDEENEGHSTLTQKQTNTIENSLPKGEAEAKVKTKKTTSKKSFKGSGKAPNLSNGSTKNKLANEEDIIDVDDNNDDHDDHDQDNDGQISDDEVAVDLARGEGNIESSSSSSENDDSDDENHSDNDVQYSNQKLVISSDNPSKSLTHNEDSTDEEDTDEEDEGIDHQWAELDSNVEKNSNTTRRLAVCNLDWDRINADDLFVVFSSLKTKGGIKSVKIYPSEFGLKRLKNEECYGPEELRQQKDQSDDDRNVEGEHFSQEKLRQYQINRLKYYYAVVEFDSPETANGVYSEYDGVEFELSGNQFDLRFIPDDMEFEHEPKSVATQMPTQAMYKPPEFETTALHQTNVKLTWDETDSNRVKTTMRAFNKDELQNMDFEAYLASSSDEDEARHPDINEAGSSDEDEDEDEEQKIAKYKSLVQEIDAKEHEGDNDNDMEITWEPGLKESALDLVAKKRAEKIEKTLTPWERYLNNKKEKRTDKRAKNKQNQHEHLSDEDEDDTPEGVDMSDPFFSQDFGPDFSAAKDKQTKTNATRKKNPKHGKDTEEDKKQKEELELLLLDENDGRQHFSLKRIMENEKKKKKRKKRRKDGDKKEDTFSVNVKDPRFSALYSSHLYAIDPSNPQFKDTNAMSAIMEERQRRRAKGPNKDEKIKVTKPATHSTDPKPIKDPSLSLLVNSVKSKTGAFNQRKMKRKHTH